MSRPTVRPTQRAAAAVAEPHGRCAGQARAAANEAGSNRVPPAPQVGVLLAVCGLCGGAGASTVSYLIARFVAERANQDVLVCDTGGLTGGLAAHTGAESPLSLAEVAEQIALGHEIAGSVYAVDGRAESDGCELRVIATAPRFAASGEVRGLRALLGLARRAHALTVVDCGTLQRDADRLALRLASHVAWVLPATGGAVHRGRRVLASLPAVDARELVIARRERRQRSAALRSLTGLARERGAPLVLLPHLPDLADDAQRAIDEARGALQAIAGVLTR
jgi:hypothetical protein